MKLNRLLRLTAFTCSWCLIYVSISSTWAQALDSSTIEKLQKETETMLAYYKKMPPSDPKRKALGEKINQNMQLLPEMNKGFAQTQDVYNKSLGTDEYKKLSEKELSGQPLTAAEKKRLKEIRGSLVPANFGIPAGNLSETGLYQSDNSYGPMKALSERTTKLKEELQKYKPDSANDNLFVENKVLKYDAGYKSINTPNGPALRKNYIETAATAAALAENPDTCYALGPGTESYTTLTDAAKVFQAKETANANQYNADVAAAKQKLADSTAKATTTNAKAPDTLSPQQEYSRDLIFAGEKKAAATQQNANELSQGAGQSGGKAGGEGGQQAMGIIGAILQILMGIIIATIGVIMFGTDQPLCAAAVVTFGAACAKMAMDIAMILGGIMMIGMGIMSMIQATQKNNSMGSKGGAAPQADKGSAAPQATAAISPDVMARMNGEMTDSDKAKLAVTQKQDAANALAHKTSITTAKKITTAKDYDTTTYGQSQVGKVVTDGSKSGMNPDFGGGPVPLNDINRHKIAYAGALSELESCCPTPSGRAAFAGQISALAARTAKEAGEAAAYLKAAGSGNQALINDIGKIKADVGHANKSDDLKNATGRTTCIGTTCFSVGTSKENEVGANDQNQGLSGNGKSDIAKISDSDKAGNLKVSDLDRKIADLSGSIGQQLIQAKKSGIKLSAIALGHIDEGSISAQRFAAVAAKVKEGKPLNIEEQQIQLFDLTKKLAALKRGTGAPTRGSQKADGTSPVSNVNYQGADGVDGTAGVAGAAGAGSADTMLGLNPDGTKAEEAGPETVNLNQELDLFKQVSTRYKLFFFPLFQEE